MRKYIKKLGVLLLSLALSYSAYGNTELEKLINNYYNNEAYDLKIKNESDVVKSRPSQTAKSKTVPASATGSLPSAVPALSTGGVKLEITQEELLKVADQIFENETGGIRENLVEWNAGESFPSLGIGHFIWFRAGQKTAFSQSFPDMLNYYRQKGVKLPKILEQNDSSPWSSRSELLAKKSNGDKDIWELIDFFDKTRDIQVMFIFERLQGSLDKMLAASDDKENLRNQFYRVANSPNGLYALIDYVNFKGEGIKGVKSYNNQAWGLRQVLENMRGSEIGQSALVEFSDSAKYVLQRRVNNAPKNERRWIAGWFNRADTYKTFALNSR